MDFEQFIEKLKETPRDWRLQWDHNLPKERVAIRRGGFINGKVYKDDCQCPVSSLLDRPLTGTYYAAYHKLHLDFDLLEDIVHAADWNEWRCVASVQALRIRMLEACGLTEDSPITII